MTVLAGNDPNGIRYLGRRAVQIWKSEGPRALLQRAVWRFTGIGRFIGSASFEDHYWTSGWQTANVQLIAGLKNSDSLIDIGCGAGRLAFGLYSWFGGRYVGVDIVPALIDYCKKQFPRFEFYQVDVQSRFYNPEGALTEEQMVLPVDSHSFDVAVLASVYTHMLPSRLVRMTAEVSRVLKPNGRCFATFFILDNQAEKSRFTFANEVSPDCRVEQRDYPEAVVGYRQSYVTETFARYGLVMEQFYRGNWTGLEGLGMQDQLLFRKVNTEGAG